ELERVRFRAAEEANVRESRLGEEAHQLIRRVETDRARSLDALAIRQFEAPHLVHRARAKIDAALAHERHRATARLACHLDEGTEAAENSRYVHRVERE